MNIYIGNLPRTATEEGLRALFENHGTVETVSIMIDKFTNEPRGFGFVKMTSDDEARKAIEALNEYEFEGRNLRVSEAHEREERRGPRPGGGGFNRDRGPRREGGFGGGSGSSNRGGGFGGRNRY